MPGIVTVFVVEAFSKSVRALESVACFSFQTRQYFIGNTRIHQNLRGVVRKETVLPVGERVMVPVEQRRRGNAFLILLIDSGGQYQRLTGGSGKFHIRYAPVVVHGDAAIAAPARFCFNLRIINAGGDGQGGQQFPGIVGPEGSAVQLFFEIACLVIIPQAGLPGIPRRTTAEVQAVLLFQ